MEFGAQMYKALLLDVGMVAAVVDVFVDRMGILVVDSDH